MIPLILAAICMIVHNDDNDYDDDEDDEDGGDDDVRWVRRGRDRRSALRRAGCECRSS